MEVTLSRKYPPTKGRPLVTSTDPGQTPDPDSDPYEDDETQPGDQNDVKL